MLNRSYINDHKRHAHHLSDAKMSSLQNGINFSATEDELLRIVKNLSDPTKLKIYLMLQKIEEMSVTDITRVLKMTQSAVSHALSDLKNLGLLESHRCGQLICYSISNKKGKNKFLSVFSQFK